MTNNDEPPSTSNNEQILTEPAKTTLNKLSEWTRHCLKNGSRRTIRFFKITFDGLNYLSPLITAIATAGVVWVAYWQWETLEKTDDSNRSVNRAFLTGKTVDIGQDLPLNWKFTPIIENSGNTKAQNVEVHVYYDFRSDETNDTNTEVRTRPLYAPQDPEDLLKRNSDSAFARFDRIPLNLKSTYPVGGIGLPLSFIDEMAKKRADGYISGVITYDDVFKGSKRHISKFCFVIQPVKKGDAPTTISGGLCQYWNCVDEIECAYHTEKYNSEVREITNRLNGKPSVSPRVAIPTGTSIRK